MKTPNTSLINTKVKPSLQKGFTMIELMVTISISGILVAIAMPSLSEFSVKTRVDNEVAEIQRLLLTARNTAINSGLNTTLCPLQNNNLNNCNAIADWTGRIGVVKLDPINGNTLIKEKAPIHNGDQLNFPAQSITYSANGRSNNAALITFSYCPRADTDLSRGVSLSISGRSYLSSDNNLDGKDQDRAGTTITCP